MDCVEEKFSKYIYVKGGNFFPVIVLVKLIS